MLAFPLARAYQEKRNRQERELSPASDHTLKRGKRMAGMQFTQIDFIQQLSCSNLATLHECPYLFCVCCCVNNPLRREKEDLMKKGAKEGRAAQVTITEEHLDKMARISDGAARAAQISDAFRVIYDLISEGSNRTEAYEGGSNGINVLFDQMIERHKEIVNQVEREALEFWNGFRTMLEEAEKAAPTGGES
jgi:hypothetical protein